MTTRPLGQRLLCVVLSATLAAGSVPTGALAEALGQDDLAAQEAEAFGEYAEPAGDEALAGDAAASEPEAVGPEAADEPEAAEPEADPSYEGEAAEPEAEVTYEDEGASQDAEQTSESESADPEPAQESAEPVDDAANEPVVEPQGLIFRDISRAELQTESQQYAYTGSAIKPNPNEWPVLVWPASGPDNAMVLRYNEDYTLSYANNVMPGTATVTVTGKGLFTGAKQVTFTIYAMAKGALSIASIPDQTYTGKAITPKPVVKHGSKTLAEGTNYRLEYLDNVEVGTARVVVRGINGYVGAVEATFNIVKPTAPAEGSVLEELRRDLRPRSVTST